MSNIANLAIATANAQASVFAPLCNSGTIAIYAGAQPATADTALTGQTLLVTLTFSSTAFGAPSGGVITANTIGTATAVASGTATFARIFKSDATTVVMDVQVGISGAGINFNSTAFVDGAPQSISSLTYSPSAGIGG